MHTNTKVFIINETTVIVNACTGKLTLKDFYFQLHLIQLQILRTWYFLHHFQFICKPNILSFFVLVHVLLRHSPSSWALSVLVSWSWYCKSTISPLFSALCNETGAVIIPIARTHVQSLLTCCWVSCSSCWVCWSFCWVCRSCCWSRCSSFPFPDSCWTLHVFKKKNNQIT